jgi:arginine deiminase
MSEPSPSANSRLTLGVWSEIGRLEDVLVHAPGPEVDIMPPSMMRELLFDDILDGREARAEHQRFRALMKALGTRVWDFQDLLAEALEADPSEVPGLISDLEHLERVDRNTIDVLRGLDGRTLANALVHGIVSDPENSDPSALFRLAPLPNLLFSRDAQIVLGDGVLIAAMTHLARRREPLLARFLFRHHPALTGSTIYEDFLRDSLGTVWDRGLPLTIEGGDILIFHEGVVIVGLSERTKERAVDRLATRLRTMTRFHTLIMVPMPHTRSAMHLDTIFTRISTSECLVYAPMVLENQAETSSVISVDLRRPDDLGTRRASLLDALRRAGVDLEPVPCGGRESYISQAREQWTDGANSFAVDSGVIFLYARNLRTADELARRGYEVIDSQRIPCDGETCTISFERGRKYAILVAGGELSRARGGPRCMTMPLARRPVGETS